MAPQAVGGAGQLPSGHSWAKGHLLPFTGQACLPMQVSVTSPGARLLTPVAAPSSPLWEGTQGCHWGLLTGETQATHRVSGLLRETRQASPPTACRRKGNN